MKKKVISIIVIILIVMIVSITTTYAANYLYNSEEVYYENKDSNLKSSDVQSAIDELYTTATDYSSINTRVNTLENQFELKTPNITFNSNDYFGSASGNLIKYGNVVQLNLSLYNIKEVPANTVLLTIPSGYRPYANCYVLFHVASDTKVYRAILYNTTGELSIQHISLPINQWYNATITYITK